MRPVPPHLRAGMRVKLARIQVLCEELAQMYEKQAPLTREEAAFARGLLSRMEKGMAETQGLGYKIQRLTYLK